MIADRQVSSDVLAGRILNRRQRQAGWLYLAHGKDVEEEKHEARKLILRALSKERVPYLNILTMPSARWIFEKALLMRRGQADWTHTRITALERDEAVYRMALKDMPGAARGIEHLNAPNFSKALVRTDHIARFHCCSFEDYAFANSVPMKDRRFNAAWLDFNGPLSMRRAEAIGRLLAHLSVRPFSLFITALDARYDVETFAFLSEYEDRGEGITALVKLFARELRRSKGRPAQTRYQNMIQLGWRLDQPNEHRTEMHNRTIVQGVAIERPRQTHLSEDFRFYQPGTG